jgi:hypothetical protein
MNFSNEELYAMYGQFDTNITITFHYNSAAYQIFGSTLMGSIIYAEDQRRDLEAAIHTPPVARTDVKIRFLPSPIEHLTAEQYEQAERFGFLCSDIYEILSYNRPRTNVFTEKGKLEIQNTITVNFNARPQEINQISFGFLNSRFSRKEPLSPGEVNKFMGLRKYFGMDNSEAPYKDLLFDEKEADYYALNAKLLDLTIEGVDMKTFASLIIERYQAREKLIQAEIERSGGKLEEVAKEHGDELKNLRDACHGFEEKVLLYGKRLVYLDLERFLHIYGRHVAETHLGGKFAVKTVFQYKYDDIIRIIHAVIESEAAAIQEHLAMDSGKNFIRIGKRSIYHEGHYYRVEIDHSGRLLTFHPYNNNEERDADGEG